MVPTYIYYVKQHEFALILINVFVLIISGIACSVILVTSQALTTDFIGDKTHRGAFTFGLMSFTDKVCNGAIVMAVQSL